jgi:hypothetical protein
VNLKRKAYFEGHISRRRYRATRGENCEQKKKQRNISFDFMRLSPPAEREAEDAKKGKGIVFNIHLFIITSPLSIITRDMLAGRRWGEYKRNKEKKCKKEH